MRPTLLATSVLVSSDLLVNVDMAANSVFYHASYPFGHIPVGEQRCGCKAAFPYVQSHLVVKCSLLLVTLTPAQNTAYSANKSMSCGLCARVAFFILLTSLRLFTQCLTLVFACIQSPWGLQCKRTHAIDPTRYGVIEIDTASWSVIQIITGMNGGQAYGTTDGQYIVDIDKGGNAIHVVKPGVSGSRSATAFPRVSCSNSPDNVAFYQYVGPPLFVNCDAFVNITRLHTHVPFKCS
jgi:hypothetical protein